jgi:hypothetical protein
MHATSGKRVCLFVLLVSCLAGFQAFAATEQQLENWLKRFPGADVNKDGRLTDAEADAFRKRLASRIAGPRRTGPFATANGASRPFTVDPGWEKDRFPRELDREFRRIAWQAALNNPLSGVTDANENQISDDRE